MEFDVVIIGAGPAGYVAAIRAGQVGLKTAVIEMKHIGGMCMNWGCIPTKAILESAKNFNKIKTIGDFGIDGIVTENLRFNWGKAKLRSLEITKKLTSGIDFLMKKNGVEVINGTARIVSKHLIMVDDIQIYAGNIILATGSKPMLMDKIPGNVPTVEIENLFSIKEIPEHIVVTGNHISSVELAQFFNLIDKKVTLVTNSPYFMDGLDEFLIDYVTKKLKSENIDLIQNVFPEKYEAGYLFVGGEKIKCDLLVNCNSRKAVLPESEIPLQLTERGFIKTNPNFETSIAGVYAIGDVSGKSFVAHVASAQGIHVINTIKGIKMDFGSQIYPINMYTSPEISQIGLTEQEIMLEGIDYKVNDFPLSANGKAMIEGNTDGFIRLLSDKKYGQVLGVQIVAANATDMISEAAAFMSVDGTVYDVAQTIHAHPTVSEIFMEAGFDAVDRAIHK